MILLTSSLCFPSFFKAKKVSHTLSCLIDLHPIILHSQTPISDKTTLILLIGTVNAFQCFQPQPITEVAFSIDVLENNLGVCKGLNFKKKCKGCPEKIFLQCLQGITGGLKK